MNTQTFTADENGRLEIVCQREHAAVANVSLTSLEGEISFLIDSLEPGESVQIDISGNGPK